MYIMGTFQSWELCLASLKKPDLNSDDLTQAAKNFLQALEYAEKHLTREPENEATAKLNHLVMFWDDASDGLDDIAPIESSIVERIKGMRTAISTSNQMTAFLYCIRGKVAYIDTLNNLNLIEDPLQEALKIRDSLQEAIKLKPGYTRAQELLLHVQFIIHFSAGNDYLQQGLFDDAVLEYEKALQIQPDNNLALDNLVVAHGQHAGYAYQAQNWDVAITEYKAVLEIKPDDWYAHKSLGLAYQMQGQLDESIDEFQITLRLNPNDDGARSALNNAYQLKKILLQKRKVGLKIYSVLKNDSLNQPASLAFKKAAQYRLHLASEGICPHLRGVGS